MEYETRGGYVWADGIWTVIKVKTEGRETNYDALFR